MVVKTAATDVLGRQKPQRNIYDKAVPEKNALSHEASRLRPERPRKSTDQKKRQVASLAKLKKHQFEEL